MTGSSALLATVRTSYGTCLATTGSAADDHADFTFLDNPGAASLLLRVRGAAG